MIEVPNVDSVAAMRALSRLLGRKVGPSTGTNFIGMLALAGEMRAAGEQGSILSLLCDAGERYLPSYHDAGLGGAELRRLQRGRAARADSARWAEMRMRPRTDCCRRRALLAMTALAMPARAAGGVPCAQRCSFRATSAAIPSCAPSGGTSPAMPRAGAREFGFQLTFFRSRVDATQAHALEPSRRGS